MRQFLFVVLAVAIVGASASLINRSTQPAVANAHAAIPVPSVGDIFNRF